MDPGDSFLIGGSLGGSWRQLSDRWVFVWTLETAF
jgi:hypothetical protein